MRGGARKRKPSRELRSGMKYGERHSAYHESLIELHAHCEAERVHFVDLMRVLITDYLASPESVRVEQRRRAASDDSTDARA